MTYAIALEQLGAELVHKYIGQEPSGRNFNELVLDENSNYHLFNYPQKHEKLKHNELLLLCLLLFLHVNILSLCAIPETGFGSSPHIPVLSVCF